MNGLFFAMLKLIFFGVKPEQVEVDRFPGKTPPKPAPKIPNRPSGQNSTSSNSQVQEAYRRFKKKYPNGYRHKRDHFEFHNQADFED
jgi:hypothetical protein